jgi:hypothetical protein
MGKFIETFILGSALAFNGAASAQTSQPEKAQVVSASIGSSTQSMTVSPDGNIVLKNRFGFGPENSYEHTYPTTCQAFVDRMSSMIGELSTSALVKDAAATKSKNLTPEGNEIQQRINGYIRQSLEFVENGIAACGKTQNPPVVPQTLAPNINTLKSALTL